MKKSVLFQQHFRDTKPELFIKHITFYIVMDGQMIGRKIIIKIIPFIYIAHQNHYALCTLHTQLHTYMHYNHYTLCTLHTQLHTYMHYNYYNLCTLHSYIHICITTIIIYALYTNSYIHICITTIMLYALYTNSNISLEQRCIYIRPRCLNIPPQNHPRCSRTLICLCCSATVGQ